MRGGGAGGKPALTEGELIQRMVGRELTHLYPPRGAEFGAEVVGDGEGFGEHEVGGAVGGAGYGVTGAVPQGELRGGGEGGGVEPDAISLKVSICIYCSSIIPIIPPSFANICFVSSNE